MFPKNIPKSFDGTSPDFFLGNYNRNRTYIKQTFACFQKYLERSRDDDHHRGCLGNDQFLALLNGFGPEKQ